MANLVEMLNFMESVADRRKYQFLRNLGIALRTADAQGLNSIVEEQFLTLAALELLVIKAIQIHHIESVKRDAKDVERPDQDHLKRAIRGAEIYFGFEEGAINSKDGSLYVPMAYLEEPEMELVEDIFGPFFSKILDRGGEVIRTVNLSFAEE